MKQKIKLNSEFAFGFAGGECEQMNDTSSGLQPSYRHVLLASQWNSMNIKTQNREKENKWLKNKTHTGSRRTLKGFFGSCRN